MLQKEALSILKTGRNVFLTGEPGSGKTHTINRYVEWLQGKKIPVAITASTGIAASHINGRTIHSWSGIGIKRIITEDDLKKIKYNKNLSKRVKETQVLIIDEISLLDPYTLSNIEKICRNIRKSIKPFGGIQVILVGDFFQIPPVVNNQSKESDFFGTTKSKNNTFAFESDVWSSLKLSVCYLSEQFRQEDQAYLDLLNAIRNKKVNNDHRNLLRSRISREPDGVPKLFSSNAQVDYLNGEILNKIKEKEVVFLMEEFGPKNLVDGLKNVCLSPQKLILKKGAAVMFTRNDPKKKYVNGTLGVICNFKNGLPLVQTKNGTIIEVERTDWRIEERGLTIAEIKQFPLRLSWAVTIHKSQGMTLESAFIDLTNAFEYGMGYVALSRIKSINGLYIAGFNDKALEVHPYIYKKDKEFRELSSETISFFKGLSNEKIGDLENLFVKSSSLINEEKVSISIPNSPSEKSNSVESKTYTLEDKRKTHKKAYAKWSEEEDIMLKERFLSGATPAELAVAHERNNGAILSRLAKLGLRPLDLSN